MAKGMLEFLKISICDYLENINLRDYESIKTHFGDKSATLVHVRSKLTAFIIKTSYLLE